MQTPEIASIAEEMDRQKNCSSCDGSGTQTRFEDSKKENCWRCDGLGFETDSQPELICPYCRFKHEDDGDGPVTGKFRCSDCRKWFMAETEYTVEFTSDKADCLNGEAEHQHKHWHTYPYEEGRDYSNCIICCETTFRDKT